jgi:hypothetical protein
MQPQIRRYTPEEVDAIYEEKETSDASIIAKILVNAKLSFAISYNPVEGDFDGDIEIAVGNRDVSFVFSRGGRLRHVVNNRPKPKPDPLAGACALKVK